MGLISSRPSLCGVVNTLQSALPRRSDRRIEPVPQIQFLSVNSPALIPRRDRHRRFRTRFWKRGRRRTSCSCHVAEDDDYASVFGRVRPDSTQSLPVVSPVRRFRSDYPTPIPPSSEFRLLIENTEVQLNQLNAAGSTYHEQTTTTTTQVNSETRVVRCRHCRSCVNTPRCSAPPPCATARPQLASNPICRACYWHNLLAHDEYSGPPMSFLSWAAENSPVERDLSTPVISPCGRPRTRISVATTTTLEPEELKSRKLDDSRSSEDVVKREPHLEHKPVPEPENLETSPCVCAIPSSQPCLCDKKLFEAMNPWNKCKTFLFVLLMFALVAWIVTFIILE